MAASQVAAQTSSQVAARTQTGSQDASRARAAAAQPFTAARIELIAAEQFAAAPSVPKQVDFAAAADPQVAARTQTVSQVASRFQTGSQVAATIPAAAAQPFTAVRIAQNAAEQLAAAPHAPEQVDFAVAVDSQVDFAPAAQPHAFSAPAATDRHRPIPDADSRLAVWSPPAHLTPLIPLAIMAPEDLSVLEAEQGALSTPASCNLNEAHLDLSGESSGELNAAPMDSDEDGQGVFQIWHGKKKKGTKSPATPIGGTRGGGRGGRHAYNTRAGRQPSHR